MDKLAVVTGAAQGIGYAVALHLLDLGYTVIMTSRNDDVHTKAAELSSPTRRVYSRVVDVTKEQDIIHFQQSLEHEFGRCDVLVNNAGVFLEPVNNQVTPSTTSMEVMKHSFHVNCIGALRMIQAVLPLMRSQEYGRIVNISSGMSQFSEGMSGSVAYRASKAALNVVTRTVADECKDTNILVNSVCPGWVKTRMGGDNATREVHEAVKGVVWAATLDDNGPRGGFFRDCQPIHW